MPAANAIQRNILILPQLKLEGSGSRQFRWPVSRHSSDGRTPVGAPTARSGWNWCAVLGTRGDHLVLAGLAAARQRWLDTTSRGVPAGTGFRMRTGARHPPRAKSSRSLGCRPGRDSSARSAGSPLIGPRRRGRGWLHCTLLKGRADRARCGREAATTWLLPVARPRKNA